MTSAEIKKIVIEEKITMVYPDVINHLEECILDTIRRGVHGDFIECGVWRGGACILAKAIYKENNKPNKVFVADSFKGLPRPSHPKDAGDIHYKATELQVSQEQVRKNFERFGLLDNDVIFLEGWFKDTLKTAPVDRLSILRLDGDMYESTMDSLEALYPKLSDGGYLIIDDYRWHMPCQQAVDEYLGRDVIKLRPVTASSSEAFYLIK